MRKRRQPRIPTWPSAGPLPTSSRLPDRSEPLRSGSIVSHPQHARQHTVPAFAVGDASRSASLRTKAIRLAVANGLHTAPAAAASTSAVEPYRAPGCRCRHDRHRSGCRRHSPTSWWRRHDRSIAVPNKLVPAQRLGVRDQLAGPAGETLWRGTRPPGCDRGLVSMLPQAAFFSRPRLIRLSAICTAFSAAPFLKCPRRPTC